jgi:hypothetical protein
MAMGIRSVASMVGTLIASACADTLPARIQVPRDTLILNSTMWTPLDVRVLNREGAVIEHASVSYTHTAPPRLQVDRNGAVNCEEDGTYVIVVSAGTAAARLPIRCHLARRFGDSGIQSLIAGGQPVPFGLSAYDEQGHLIQHVRLPLIITDTTTIQLRDGMVYGLKPGRATIWTQSFGREGGMGFEVTAPPRITDSLRRQNHDRKTNEEKRRIDEILCNWFLLLTRMSAVDANRGRSAQRRSCIDGVH